MQVFLNETLIEVPEDISLSEVLSTHASTYGVFAVALNHTFIPRQSYHTTVKHHDRIDIVIPMQGG